MCSKKRHTLLEGFLGVTCIRADAAMLLSRMRLNIYANSNLCDSGSDLTSQPCWHQESSVTTLAI